ncbi:hypothetical protein B0T13DRAFT_479236 [Neurospora crassa]|nr:hypothetical protein B0T13DRAFT_479236 [Neurospora crassa]
MSNLQVPGEQGEGKVRAVSNPLPGLASLNFHNNRGDAQQDYEAAQASRANATLDEIEQRGIVPDVNLVERELLRPKSRIKKAGSDAHKIFSSRAVPSHNPTSSSDVNTLDLGLRVYPSNDELDAVVNTLWRDFANDGGLNGLSHQQIPLLYQHWHQRALAINESAKEWQALNVPSLVATEPSASTSTFDLFGSLMTDFELLLEVCKHLRPIDIINLYSISKTFHDLVNANLQSTILLWTDHMAPTSARIFCHQLYYQYFIDDPSGKNPSTHRDIRYFNQPAPNHVLYENQHGEGQAGPVNPLPPADPQHSTRKVPSLIWFQMVVDRETKVRDILATLSRHGHRTPHDTHKTLKKLWLLMDVASCRGRAVLIHSQTLFTDEDLYRARLFFIKLYMLFADPIFGPKSTALAKLFLGQKGFTPLWQFLRRKKYTTEEEIVEMKTRYDVRPTLLQVLDGHPINGVPPNEMGKMHVEGWGRGVRHLLRPDQMVNWEAYKRGLALHLRAERMMLYGHVDFSTGRPLVPSLDEMYMSDDEFDLPANSSWRIMKHRKAHGGCGNVPFERGMWQPKHARKAGWKTLTEEEKEDILAAEDEEVKEEKKLRYVDGDLDVALADLEEALYDYAVEKEEGSHEEHGIDGLEFDSRVPMPDDILPGDEEADFDDTDWENCAKYMTGLDRLPDQLTRIRQGKAHGQLNRSLIMAKQVFDSKAKSNAEGREQDEAWARAIVDQLPLYIGGEPAYRRGVPVAPRNNSPASNQAFFNAHNGNHDWVQPVYPAQAEIPDVRAEYLLKAAVALYKARLDTGDLDPATDAMPDDEVAELEDEQITVQIEKNVNYGWMLHMPRTQPDSEGARDGSPDYEDHSGNGFTSEVSDPIDMDIEEDIDCDDDDDDDFKDLITSDFDDFITSPNFGVLHESNNTDPNNTTIKEPSVLNQHTPNHNPFNPHNPDVPYPNQMYHYNHDPDEEFDWRAWLDMQHQNDLLSEAARLDQDLLNGAHEAGPEELRRRVESTIERTQGYKNLRERFLRGYYRQW